VCQTLWRERRAEYHSPELDFESIHMMPKPLQAGGVPLWISGTVNPRVVNRLARFGIGWIPWGPAAADVVAGVDQMRAALTEVGRDPADLQVVGRLPLLRDQHGSLDLPRSMDIVPELWAAGITDFRIALRLDPDPSRALDRLRDVVDAFRAVTVDSAGGLPAAGQDGPPPHR
jgi:hypothetical protein